MRLRSWRWHENIQLSLLLLGVSRLNVCACEARLVSPSRTLVYPFVTKKLRSLGYVFSMDGSERSSLPQLSQLCLSGFGYLLRVEHLIDEFGHIGDSLDRCWVVRFFGVSPLLDFLPDLFGCQVLQDPCLPGLLCISFAGLQFSRISPLSFPSCPQSRWTHGFSSLQV